MLLDIWPKKYPTLNCYDNNIIAGIADYFDRDYLICTLASFDFSYYPERDRYLSLLQRFNFFTGDILYAPVLLKKFCGISLRMIERKEFESQKKESFLDCILQRLDSKKPVGVRVDSFFLPWNNYCQQWHRAHNLLVIGADLVENVFYCSDGYLSECIEKIAINVIMENYDQIVFIDDISDVPEDTDPSGVIQCVFDNLSKTGKSKNCDMIRTFAEDIGHSKFTEEDELFLSNLNMSDFFFRLTDIIWSRKNFADGLALLNERAQSTAVDKAREKALNVSGDWEKLRSVLMKGFLTHDNARCFAKTMEILHRIADEEEYVLELLRTGLGDRKDDV